MKSYLLTAIVRTKHFQGSNKMHMQRSNNNNKITARMKSSFIDLNTKNKTYPAVWATYTYKLATI